MYKKVCPNCNSNSYSSSKKGKWTCPNCRANLKEEPAKLS